MAQHILDVQLPDQNPHGAPGGDYQQISSNPSMFGGTTARALETFGQGVEKAGITGIDVATEQAQLQGKVHATDVKSWYADQATDLHSKFMALEGRNAIDQLDGYKKQLSGLKDQAWAKSPARPPRRCWVNR
jgi:hypothetical protein